MYIIGHQYPTSNISLYVISITKCPFDGPACNLFITIYVYVLVKHLHSLLSWPILYNSPFYSVKGSTFLTDLYYCCKDIVPLIYPIFLIKITSLSHLGLV
jgi:hypothetical protein